MFGKAKMSEAARTLEKLLFQSPCAGNMFGKVDRSCSCCMKLRSSFNPRVRGTCLVRAGVRARRGRGAYRQGPVSIPVCGEHVW